MKNEIVECEILIVAYTFLFVFILAILLLFDRSFGIHSINKMLFTFSAVFSEFYSFPLNSV